MKRSASFLALLTLSGLGHALSGQVQDANGKPIAGATIELLGSHQQVLSDAQGSFKLDVDDSQVDEVHINAPGYSHETLHLHGEHRGLLTVKLYRSVIEQVDVTAVPLHISVMESAQPVTVVAGEELRRKQASTLGETLKNEVGVHSSYFGPVASTPIIRGLNGPRVLITQNGLDVSDASRVGPDHVVSTEASTAEQIEILRGPATLLYGSGAIGGVVNIVDDRVPSSSEERGAFAIGHNSVADENEASFAYTGGTEQFAFHIDGFKRDGNNYEIPGAAALEADHDHEDEHEEEHDHEEEGRDGVLENSASESKGFNIGGSWLLDNGYIGLSYGRLERLNGIPGHSHAHEEEEEHEGEEEHEHEEDVAVQSDLEQDRWQLISELSLDNQLLSGINTRIGYTDYEHKEIEGGEIGTIFRNETLQARVDLLLQEMSGWRGALSFEGTSSDFEAIGEEAFTPPAKTESYAVALMEEKHIGNVLVQLGARIEQVSIKADPIEWENHHAADEADRHTLLRFDELEFTPVSLSAGLVWEFTPGYNAGISLTHAQRAPSAAELFSYGPHIGSSAFEVGAVFDLHAGDHPHFHYHDDDISEEVSNNIDLSLRKHSGNLGWIINVFYNEIDDFYYQRNTGYSSGDLSEHDHEEGGEEEEHEHEHGHDDFPVYVFQQADATLFGVEAQLAWQFYGPLKLTLMADSTRGKLKDGGNLPRIPPARLGGQLSYQSGGWNAGFGMSRYFEQDRVAELETTTDAYTLMDAEVAYTFAGLAGDSDVTLYLKGSNLSDEEARVHSSFLKDLAPLPGRNISIGLRGSF